MKTDDIDTPAVLVDLDKVQRNLEQAQAYADQHGLYLRPHVKTHKLPNLAKRQMELGAIGITCQKIGEAEAMAEAGLSDIFLPYNIIGAAKLSRLHALNGLITLSVTADSAFTIKGYGDRFSADRPLHVLIECDTGAGRCGVQSAEQAVALAQQIAACPGLVFSGLMTYPPQNAMAKVETWLRNAKDALCETGLPPQVISIGGTPDLMRAAENRVATEYRPGTYIYSDRMQFAWGHGTLTDCALTVKATVVSRPNPARAVIDAGSKALAADPVPPPFTGHGHVVEYPEAVLTALSEEHGVIDLSASTAQPEIGETVRVIPNHACVVTNLFDRVHLVRGDRVERVADVSSRGRLQ